MCHQHNYRSRKRVVSQRSVTISEAADNYRGKCEQNKLKNKS